MKKNFLPAIPVLVLTLSNCALGASLSQAPGEIGNADLRRFDNQLPNTWIVSSDKGGVHRDVPGQCGIHEMKAN